MMHTTLAARARGLFHAIVGVLALLGPVASQAATTEWRLAHYLPQEHFFARWLEGWARQIERDSGGQLRITIVPNNQLLRLGAIAPGVRDGKAELGFGPAPEAPEFAALGLPFVVTSATDGTRLVGALEREGAFAQALEGLEVLFLQTNAPSVIHTRAVDVRRPEQLAGLRMRGATPYIRALLAALGSTPIDGLLAPQVYGALRDGKIDGTVFPYEAMGVFRLGEQLRFHLEVPLFVSTLGLFMNPQAYGALPDDLRAVVDRHRGAAAARAAAAAWDAEEANGRAIADKLGNRRQEPSAAELRAWREHLAPFTAQELARLGPRAAPVHRRAEQLATRGDSSEPAASTSQDSGSLFVVRRVP
jgi:TRAP-type transport system periplasmic protein